MDDLGRTRAGSTVGVIVKRRARLGTPGLAFRNVDRAGRANLLLGAVDVRRDVGADRDLAFVVHPPSLLEDRAIRHVDGFELGRRAVVGEGMRLAVAAGILAARPSLPLYCPAPSPFLLRPSRTVVPLLSKSTT